MIIAAVAVAALVGGGVAGYLAADWNVLGFQHSSTEHSAGETDHQQHESHEGHAESEGESAEAGSHEGHAGHDEQGESGSSNAVHLSAEQAGNLDIEVEALQSGSAQATLDRPATVMWAMDNLARVGPRVSAKVQSVAVDLGDQVEKGQVLATMSSVQLGKAKADYLAAKARLATNQANYKRQQTLRKQDIASEAALLEAEAAYHEAKAKHDAARETLRVLGVSESEIADIEAGSDEPLSVVRLRSPVSGVIQKRDLVVGDTISGNDTPLHIVNTDRMWVMVDAYDRDIPLLTTGQELTFTARSLPDQSFTGTIDWISGQLNKETRTVQVRAVVGNPDEALKAGLYGTAHVQTNAETDQAVLAPLDAVQKIHGESVVFVPGDEANTYKPVHITLGRESEKWAEITDGIAAGQKVVTNGAFDLKAAFTAQGRSAAHSH
jgi:cobalt-zinc-cadmium efflux system membrane fusion protein